jgi:hypothetical protein
MHKFQLAVLVMTFCLSLPNPLRAEAPGARASQVISMTASQWHPVSDRPDGAICHAGRLSRGDHGFEVRGSRSQQSVLS